MVVMHKCDNPSCVNPQHLGVGTSKENTRDAVRKGRMSHGEEHYSAKLTEEQVRQIRTNSMGRNEASRHFGVSWKMITKIRQGVSWRLAQ